LKKIEIFFFNYLREKYFKKAKISLVALIKIVHHAKYNKKLINFSRKKKINFFLDKEEIKKSWVICLAEYLVVILLNY